MPVWTKMADEIGPEKILHVYDSKTGMKGVVVVDTVSLGGAGGGTRMLPDISTAEIFQLARAMTTKYAILDFPVGGAKAGIWGDPSIKGRQRKELMMSFGNAIKPLLSSGIVVAADMGTDNDDVALFFEGAGLPKRFTGLSTQYDEGEPLEDHVTGYGVVVAALAACRLAKVAVQGAAAAVEGFGKVGGGVLRYITEAGAKVVAISTVDDMIYNRDGLDVKALLAERKRSGDKAVSAYRDAKHMKPAQLYGLPVDILIPGARPYLINKKNAGSIKAKVISSIANIPITDDAEDLLFRKGIMSVPDFISNSGGVILGVVDVLGGKSEDVFKVVNNYIGPIAEKILKEARQKNINPHALAVGKTTAKVLKAKKRPPADVDIMMIMDELRAKLGI